MKHQRPFITLLALAFTFSASSTYAAQNPSGEKSHVPVFDQAAVDKLNDASNGSAKISFRKGTGAADNVNLLHSPGLKFSGSNAKQKTSNFFKQHGGVFGIKNPSADLQFTKSKTSHAGATHTKYRQQYKGIPVVGAELTSTVNRNGKLIGVSGTFVPGINVSTKPTLAESDASAIAVDSVAAQKGVTANALSVSESELQILNDGILKDVSGNNHLVYKVTVGNDANILEYVFVDAHDGKVVATITGIHDAHDPIERYVHQQSIDSGGVITYPTIWSEGDPFPTGILDVNKVVIGSGYAWDVIRRITQDQYLSYDGSNAAMNNHLLIYDESVCPNAYNNPTGSFFCPGITSLDVVAHEWGHGYTRSTSNLIYSWQSGALNESFSDILGETAEEVQRIENGQSVPAPTRAEGLCSDTVGELRKRKNVYAEGIFLGEQSVKAKSFIGKPAEFGPNVEEGNDVFSTEMVLVNDGTNVSSDGCESPVNSVSGKIVLIDRGACNFTQKVANAEAAGALGVVVLNNQNGDEIFTMGAGPNPPTITIPSVMISQNNGALLKSALSDGLQGAMGFASIYIDSNVRWALGNDPDSDFGGSIRDMWDPNCIANKRGNGEELTYYGQPSKVTDISFYCGYEDSRGVHINSSLSNHTYSLLVDGGEFNGQSISPIGLDKAINIYWYAQENLHNETTTFKTFAENVELACDILAQDGTTLYSASQDDTAIGALTAADCEQVRKTMLAVEMKSDVPCNFGEQFDPNPAPARCNGGEVVELASYNFDDGMQGWTVDSDFLFPERTIFWQLTSDVPNGKGGQAFLATDPNNNDDPDSRGLQYLVSPVIAMPPQMDAATYSIHVDFKHAIASEFSWDGGMVAYSLHGKDGYQSDDIYITKEEFIYNPYNGAFLGASDHDFYQFDAFTGPLDRNGLDDLSLTWYDSQLALAVFKNPHLMGGAQPRYFSNDDKIQLKFLFYTDWYTGSDLGWYVDDVSVYMCREPGAYNKGLGNQ